MKYISALKIFLRAGAISVFILAPDIGVACIPTDDPCYCQLPCTSGREKEPSLTISSPATATVVKPGETIQIMVSATAPSLIAKELLIAETPLGVTVSQAAASQLIFNLAIPPDILPGKYHVTAVGSVQGGSINSLPITLIVSLSPEESQWKVKPRILAMPYAGVKIPLSIRGMVGRKWINLSSPNVMFASDNPNVATVNAQGIVTAQSAGQTQITVTYNSGTGNMSTKKIAVQVSGGIRGDLNGDGKVDRDDLNILMMYLNTIPSITNDARDLNHDGQIDTLDIQILTTLCTYPKCATHP